MSYCPGAIDLQQILVKLLRVILSFDFIALIEWISGAYRVDVWSIPSGQNSGHTLVDLKMILILTCEL